MDRVYALAERAAALDEVPVGAVVVLNGAIISEAHNEREAKQSPTAHAEVLALERAAQALGTYRLEECVLYVSLEPCPMCLGAAQQARVKEVYFGAHDQKGGALSLGYSIHENARFPHRFLVSCLPEDRFGQLLKKFFKSLRDKTKKT